jgi:uncharacterized protein YbbC (DUF1343 family)
VTERNKIKPLVTSIVLLSSIKKLYPDDFLWRKEAYEFVNDRLAIDLLYGNPTLREAIESDTLSINNLESTWEEDIKVFSSHREACLIY